MNYKFGGFKKEGSGVRESKPQRRFVLHYLYHRQWSQQAKDAQTQRQRRRLRKVPSALDS